LITYRHGDIDVGVLSKGVPKRARDSGHQTDGR
jgi:hypothetical protein